MKLQFNSTDAGVAQSRKHRIPCGNNRMPRHLVCILSGKRDKMIRMETNVGISLVSSRNQRKDDTVR